MTMVAAYAEVFDSAIEPVDYAALFGPDKFNVETNDTRQRLQANPANLFYLAVTRLESPDQVPPLRQQEERPSAPNRAFAAPKWIKSSSSTVNTVPWRKLSSWFQASSPLFLSLLVTKRDEGGAAAMESITGLLQGLNSSLTRVQNAAAVEPNWDGYGARAPQPIASENANAVLVGFTVTHFGEAKRLGTTFWPDAIYPMPNGAIQIEWRIKEALLQVECLSSGLYSYLLDNIYATREVFEERHRVEQTAVEDVIRRYIADENR